MKIGIYHHTFMKGSGIDSVIKEVADRLSKKNQVEINTFFSDRHDCKAKIRLLSRSKSKSVFNANNPATTLRTIKSVKKYDVVMTHIYPMNLLVSIASVLYKKPHIAYFWGAPPSWMVKGIAEKSYHKFLHLTELFVPKLGVKKSLLPNGFIKKWNKNKKATILPMHGVNLKKFSSKNVDKSNCKKILKRHNIPTNAKILFTLGRVTPYKGVDLLIKALKKVRQKQPNTYLIVGGSLWNKEHVKYLKSIADDHTILAGLISEKDLVDYYSLCDVYVSASKWEGQLNAEALAMGKPYIAFDTTSHRYTIDNGNTGFLIKPYNTRDFAKKILKVLEDKKLSKKLSKNGIQWVQDNMNYDKIVEKLEKEMIQK